MEPIRRSLPSVGVVAIVLALALAGAASAQPRWGVGVQFGWGPPIHHYPPHYHPSPYYAVPHHRPPPPVAGEGCYAGAYVCPLEGPARVGMPCSCPTGQGQVWGRAR